MFAVLLVVMRHRHLAVGFCDIKVFFRFANDRCVVVNGRWSIVKICVSPHK